MIRCVWSNLLLLRSLRFVEKWPFCWLYFSQVFRNVHLYVLTRRPQCQCRWQPIPDGGGRRWPTWALQVKCSVLSSSVRRRSGRVEHIGCGQSSMAPGGATIAAAGVRAGEDRAVAPWILACSFLLCSSPFILLHLLSICFPFASYLFSIYLSVVKSWLSS